MSKLRTMTTLGCMLVSCTLGTLSAQQKLSRKELHKLLATANSPGDFAKLELYYRGEAAHYQTLAWQEEDEMRRSQNAVPWEKSPRRSESAKQLSEYYQQIATRDMELAEKYKRTAQPNQ